MNALFSSIQAIHSLNHREHTNIFILLDSWDFHIGSAWDAENCSHSIGLPCETMSYFLWDDNHFVIVH